MISAFMQFIRHCGMKKRKIKKLFSALLAACLILQTPITSFATSVTSNNIETNIETSDDLSDGQIDETKIIQTEQTPSNISEVDGLEEATDSTDSTKTSDTQTSEINSQTTDNNDNEDSKNEVETNDNLENNLQNNLDDENEESQTINEKDDNQENVEDSNVILNDLNTGVSLLNNDIMLLSLPTLQQFDEIYILSEDGIPSQYAWGIVNTNVGSGNISVHGLEGPNGSGQYYGSNTSKNTNIYVEYQGAAKIGNETYDIRIYPWSNQSSEYGRYYMQATGGIGGAFNDTTNDNVTLEFHFYKDGEEVSFSGIMYFPDIDHTEGIGFVQGANSIYLSPDSEITKDADSVFRGISDNGTASDPDDENWGDKHCLYVAFDHTADAPFTILYDAGRTHSSAISSLTSTIQLRTSSKSDYEANQLLATISDYATYASYTPPTTSSSSSYEAPVVPGYDFDGWYLEDDMTTKVTDVVITNKTTTTSLYAAYVVQKNDMTVEIEWDDDNDRDGIRPDIVKVDFNKNGTKYSDHSLTDDNDWSATVEDVPAAEGGELIEWAFQENTIDGYTLTNVSTENFVTTFTYQHIPETTDVTATLEWTGDNEDARPDSISVELLANETKTGNILYLTDDNEYTVVFEDQYRFDQGVEIEYDVLQTVPNGYEEYNHVIDGYDIYLYNQPWKAYVDFYVYDSITQISDEKMADAVYALYEYDAESQEYVRLQTLSSNDDGTFSMDSLLYDTNNQGKFMIKQETPSEGHMLDEEKNTVYFHLSAQNQISVEDGSEYNEAGNYTASESTHAILKAYEEPWKVKVSIDKIDSTTNNRLSGVKFDLYRFDKNTNEYIQVTDYDPISIPIDEQADGTYLSDWIYWNADNQGKFYVVESEAREGYFGGWLDRISEVLQNITGENEKDKTIYYFSFGEDENGTTLIASDENAGTLSNDRTLGKVTIISYDVESESSVVQGEGLLDGAEYQLIAAEDIVHADGHTGVIYKAGDVVMTGTIGISPDVDKEGYLLNTDGQRYRDYGGEVSYIETPGETTFYNIELGKYIIKESKASDGYMLDTTEYQVTFTYESDKDRIVMRDETSSMDDNLLTIDDAKEDDHTIYSGSYVKKQGFTINKISGNDEIDIDPLVGAGFKVYLVDNLSKVQDGSITPVGDGWTANDLEAFYSYDFTEEETATLFKRTEETWTSGDTEWLESTGTEDQYRVKEMFTDENGQFTSPELPYGTYIVVETTVPEDHVMTQPFFVYITKDGGVEYTDASKTTIKNEYDEETNIRYGDRNRETEGRVPQEFQYITDMRTTSYIKIMKTDSQYTGDAAIVLKPNASYRIKVVEQTERGEETNTELGWVKDEEGYLSYNDQGTIDNPFTTKTITENGIITDAYVITPVQLAVGTYSLEEVGSPSGYVLNGFEESLTDTSTDINSYQISENANADLLFTINNEFVYPDGQMGSNKYTSVDEDGNIVCTIYQDNQEQKGIVEIVSSGERLAAVNDDGNGSHVFEYQETALAGSVFEIHAAEDIYSQQIDANQLENYENPGQYLVYEKDELIGTVTTDETGYAYLANLYIGKYYVKQISAVEGYIIDTSNKYFEIEPQASKENYDWTEVVVTNERQKIDITVKKTDVDTGEAVKDTVFGLYANDRILSTAKAEVVENADFKHITKTFNYVQDTNGTVLLGTEELIATAKTDGNGVAHFDVDLPLGQYVVKEIEAADGYTSSDQTFIIDASYTNAFTPVLTFAPEFEDQKTKTIISVKDIESEVSISGATMQLVRLDENENEEVIDAWTSGGPNEENYFLMQNGFAYNASEVDTGETFLVKEGHLIEGLIPGEEYIIRIVMAPENYVGYENSSDDTKDANKIENTIEEEIRFIAGDTNEVVEYQVKLQRTTGAFTITNDGQFLTGIQEEKTIVDKIKDLFYSIFDYTTGHADNSVFEVYVKNDIYAPDGTKTIATWTNDSGDKIELYKDAFLTSITTGRDGTASLENLPLGSYYLKAASKGIGDQVVSGETHDIVLSYIDQNTPVVYLTDEAILSEKMPVDIQLQIVKEGTDTGIQGVIYGLYTSEDIYGYTIDEDGIVTPYGTPIVKANTLIEKAESDTSGKIVFKTNVPCGKYYVKELKSVSGYISDNRTIELDASYNNELMSVNIRKGIEKETTKVYIQKLAGNTNKLLKNAELAIYLDGKEIVSWKSTDEEKLIEGLEVGETYVLKETKAPSGYYKADDISFEVEDRDKETGEYEKQVIKMIDKKKPSKKGHGSSSGESTSSTYTPSEPTTPENPPTGDRNQIGLYLIVLASSFIIITSYIINRKRRK